MREELPSWAEEEDARAPAEPAVSRPWVLVLAVLPWLVVLGLVLTGLPGEGPPEPAVPVAGPTAEPANPPVGDEPGAEHTAGDPAAAPEGPTDPDASVPARVGSGAERSDTPGPSVPATGAAAREPRAAATALLVARAWLTDVGPRLEVAGLRPRPDVYLEHTAVESVDVFGEHAVVTLSAVVLEREGDVYTAAEPRRLGVPVALGDPPRPAGDPWWLEDVDLSTSEPELVEERDPDTLLALGEALGELGAGAGDVHEAARTADGWWVVSTDPPSGPRRGGDEEPVRVWVRPDVGPPAARTGGPYDDHDEVQEE